MNKKVLSLGVMLSLVTTGAFAADVVTTSVNNGDQLSKYQKEAIQLTQQQLAQKASQDAQQYEVTLNLNEDSTVSLALANNRTAKQSLWDYQAAKATVSATAAGKNPSKNRPKTTPEDLKKAVEELFEKKKEKQDDFKTQNRQEYLKKYILEIIKKIAAQHAGIDKQDGSDTYDKKQMLQHMLGHQNYRLLGDKYDLKDARYVQFFIDTSGVYGCGSNKIMHELIPEIIRMLEKQGYECYIAACGNGFYERDMVEDEYYGTRKTLEGYKTGKVSKIACPTPQTAAKMANEAEFSVVLADFDGLSSICEMANLCQKDKVPYFLSTEDRYPWEEPTLHEWVDPDLCYYNPKLVYDVSIDGNPTLEQYEERQYYEPDDEYEQDDGYDYDD